MRRELVIFMVLLSLFLAIGCTDTGNEGTEQNGTSAGENTPAEEPVTPVEAVTPTEEPQPIDEGKIVEVAIQESTFEPASVTISAGDTVRWTNMDQTAHTATGSVFDSGTLQPGESYEFLFTDSGVYNYKCSIHPTMEGTVTVEEKEE